MLVSCMLETVHTLLCESIIFNKYCTIKTRIWSKINLEYHDYRCEDYCSTRFVKRKISQKHYIPNSS